MSGDRDLVTVYVDLPNHWAASGEALWAQPLGDNLYELLNVPFFAYDLNFLDIVEATSGWPDLKIQVRRVVRRSGHRTVRVFFQAVLAESERQPTLEQLILLGATYETATEAYYALDIAPDADYDAVCEQLTDWERQGLLDFETCEAREPGSFDEVASLPSLEPPSSPPN